LHLAADITVTIDGASVRLRPSLGAAIRLEARHGFPAIVNGIVGGDLSIFRDVIREAGDQPGAVLDVLDRIHEIGLVRLDVLKPALLDLVAAMAGYDGDEPEQPAKKSKAKQKPTKPVTHAEHFAKLYSIGTGWLGWTPAATWAATPAEIMTAQEGRIEMLNAIFSGKKSKEADRANMSLSDKIRLTMSALGAKRAGQ
jgi:hypothetical protein